MYRFFNTNMYRFDQSDKCARQITLIFKKKVHEEGHSWKNLTNEMLNLYWEEFQVRVNVMLILVMLLNCGSILEEIIISLW